MGTSMNSKLQSLLQQRREIKEESQTLRNERHRSVEAACRLRLLSRRLRRLKALVYYHRHYPRQQPTKRHISYCQRRIRYLDRRLRVFQQLPQEQLVNLSTTAGQMCDRIEAKRATQQQKLALLAISTHQ